MNASGTRRGTTEWDPWLSAVPNAAAANSKRCVFCGWSKVYVRKRALSHFGWGGSDKSKRCPRAPRRVLEKFKNCGGVVPQAMSYKEMYGEGGTSAAAAAFAGAPFGLTLGMDAGPSLPDDTSSVDSNLKIVVLKSMTPNRKQELDETWASVFYESNIPLDTVRNPAFVDAVRETAAFGGFVYLPPSYDALCNELMEGKKVAVAHMVSLRTRLSIELYGATICLNGLPDTYMKQQSVDIMLVCPAGDVFLGSIDRVFWESIDQTARAEKVAAYIVDTMTRYMEDVGPQNIVQFCTNNAAAMVIEGTMSKLRERYPHTYTQGCAAHSLDLLLEDWGKEAGVKDLVEHCKAICVFIKRHQQALAVFRKYSLKKKALRVPAETRFAGNFLMIERLVECKEAVRNLVSDDTFQSFVTDLFGLENECAAIHQAIEDICSDVFWLSCENFLHLVEPVLVALRVFDGRKPATPDAWFVMNTLREHVYSLRKEPFNLTPTTATKFEKAFEARCKLMVTDLHYTGAFLNPFLKNVDAIQANVDAKRALNRVFRKLSGPLGVSCEEACKELTQYEESTGPFDPRKAPLPDTTATTTDLLPHEWWNRVGGNALPQIAKHVLSLTCSSSSSWERHGSIVYGEAPNRLSRSKTKDLEYIYANCKLGRETRGHNPARFHEGDLDDGDSEEEEEEEEEGLLPEGSNDDAMEEIDCKYQEVDDSMCESVNYEHCSERDSLSEDWGIPRYLM